MSYWTTVIKNDISNIRAFNYPKLNCIQQTIADLFQAKDLTVLEVEMILEGMKNHVMLNADNAEQLYREKNAELIKIEKVEDNP